MRVELSLLYRALTTLYEEQTKYQNNSYFQITQFSFLCFIYNTHENVMVESGFIFFTTKSTNCDVFNNVTILVTT